MSENTEIRIIGTEVQENNALVYADTKLQTLDRRVGKDNGEDVQGVVESLRGNK